jgi:hypothetical protein
VDGRVGVSPGLRVECSCHVLGCLLLQHTANAIGALVSIRISRHCFLVLSALLVFVGILPFVAILILLLLLLIGQWLLEEGGRFVDVVVHHPEVIDERSTQPKEVDHQLAHLSRHVAVDGLDFLAQVVALIVRSHE